MNVTATIASTMPLISRAMLIDQRCATYPASRFPSGMPPRKASMKIDITRPRMESDVASCTSEL